MLNRPPLSLAAVALLAVGLSACSGGSATTAKTPSPSSTASPTGSPSPTTDTTTATSAPRTVAVLKSALLVLDDLPTGFAVDPADASGGNGGPASSKDPKCAPLVRLINAKTVPGSKASANVSFSGGQDGPFVGESIDAMGSVEAVEAAQASFKSAVAACHKVNITIPGQGSSAMNVAAVSAPKFGEHTVAARLTATGGPLAGLEITQVAAGVKDVIVSISFMAALADEVDAATEAAVGKAKEVLSGASSGA